MCYVRAGDGRSFQSQFQVRNKTVFCDIAINPKLRCCLPQTAHLVCYNIMYVGTSTFHVGPSLERALNSALCYPHIATRVFAMCIFRVDWQFLNDGDGNYRHTTNFSQLCRAMLRKAGHRRGRYSSVSI